MSRITGKSHNLNMDLTLDIANELYPLTENEIITLAVARSLVPDELEVDGESQNGDEDAPRRVKRELWRSGDQGLAADFEYVMHGKVSQTHPWFDQINHESLISCRYTNSTIHYKGRTKRESTSAHRGNIAEMSVEPPTSPLAVY